jgi:hypothetical protein
MNTMTKFGTLIVATALFSLPGLTLAHPEHDEPPAKVQAAEVKAELTGTKTGATVRLTKEGKAVSTKGANGTLTVLDGDKETELKLKPANGGAMTAKSKTAISGGTRAKVSITFADKTTLATDVVAK